MPGCSQITGQWEAAWRTWTLALVVEKPLCSDRPCWEERATPGSQATLIRAVNLVAPWWQVEIRSAALWHETTPGKSLAKAWVAPGGFKRGWPCTASPCLPSPPHPQVTLRCLISSHRPTGFPLCFAPALQTPLGRQQLVLRFGPRLGTLWSSLSPGSLAYLFCPVFLPYFSVFCLCPWRMGLHLIYLSISCALYIVGPLWNSTGQSREQRWYSEGRRRRKAALECGWTGGHMGPAEERKRTHRVHCVKEHGGRGGRDSPTLDLDGVTAWASGWFGASHAHRSSGSHWPSESPVLLSEALGGGGSGPASEHQLLGFSSLQGRVSLASLWRGF